MSAPRHPSRDATLRDGLGQLKEQRGISIEKFARTLNSLAHALCPQKTAEMPCLASFTTVDESYDHAVMSWNKRVQRWANGSVEFPAWLEEPWAAALEELGDQWCRVELARRHGFMGVRRPEGQRTQASAFTALGAVSEGAGRVLSGVSKMLADGVLDAADRPVADQALVDIDDAIAELVATRELIRSQVYGDEPSLKAVK